MEKVTTGTIREQNLRLELSETAANGKPYRPAKLYDFGGDVRKKWVIAYSVWSEQQGKLVRRTYKGDLNTPKNAKDRHRLAQKLIKQINHYLAAGYVFEKQETPKAPTPGLLEAFRAFIERKTGKISAGHRDNYETVFKHVKAFLEAEKLSSVLLKDFGPEIAYRFVDYVRAGRSNKTANNYLNEFCTFLNDCKRRRLIVESPLAELERLTEESEKYLPFTSAQAAEFIRRSEEHKFFQLILFVRFLYYTFLRPRSELRFLQVKHLYADKIFVPAKRAKNNKNEWVEIPAPLEKLIQEHNLRSYPPEYYVFTASGTPGPAHVGELYFWKQHHKILKEMGLQSNYSLYGWKHTGNIALYRAGVKLIWIQKQNRHGSVAQTEKYLASLGVIENNEVKHLFPEL